MTTLDSISASVLSGLKGKVLTQISARPYPNTRAASAIWLLFEDAPPVCLTMREIIVGPKHEIFAIQLRQEEHLSELAAHRSVQLRDFVIATIEPIRVLDQVEVAGEEEAPSVGRNPVLQSWRRVEGPSDSSGQEVDMGIRLESTSGSCLEVYGDSFPLLLRVTLDGSEI